MIDKNLLSYEAQQMDELCLTRGINETVLYKNDNKHETFRREECPDNSKSNSNIHATYLSSLTEFSLFTRSSLLQY